MKLSTRSHYGLRAMAALGCAYGKGPLSLADIAEAEDLSLAYLEQLVAALRRAGLVKATRGASGGYQLAREPQLISVGEIVRVLDGPQALLPLECAADDAQACCDRGSACITRDVWVKMRESIEGVLDGMTLHEVCESGQRTASLTGKQESFDGEEIDLP